MKKKNQIFSVFALLFCLFMAVEANAQVSLELTEAQQESQRIALEKRKAAGVDVSNVAVKKNIEVNGTKKERTVIPGNSPVLVKQNQSSTTSLISKDKDQKQNTVVRKAGTTETQAPVNKQTSTTTANNTADKYVLKSKAKVNSNLTSVKGNSQCVEGQNKSAKSTDNSQYIAAKKAFLLANPNPTQAQLKAFIQSQTK